MLPRETQQQTLQTVESGARGETQPAKKTERYIVDMGSASAGPTLRSLKTLQSCLTTKQHSKPPIASTRRSDTSSTQH